MARRIFGLRAMGARVSIAFLMPFLLSAPCLAQSGQLQVDSLVSSVRLAPGDTLSYTVKLLNFGTESRVDVTVVDRIFTIEDDLVLTHEETVAVDTTATFVKNISLPDTIEPGKYYLKSSVRYPNQQVPAVSRFDFTVELKILGLFPQEFYALIAAAIVAIVGIVTVFRWAIKRRGRLNVPRLFDYSDKPREQIIFYEIISDTITQMRLRAGDTALELAADIPGLKINIDTGKVLEIDDTPSKIMALLVLRYETLLGQKVDIKVRPRSSQDNDDLHMMHKSIEIIRKYFE